MWLLRIFEGFDPLLSSQAQFNLALSKHCSDMERETRQTAPEVYFTVGSI